MIIINFDLFYLDHPILLNSFPDSHVNASLEVMLECTFQMFPLTTPHVTWFHSDLDVTKQQEEQQGKEKYEIQQSLVWSSKYHYVVTSRLFIKNLTYMDSSGVVCSADNGIGSGGTKKTFDLFISCE